MLNTLATEALSSASFVDNFIDSVDHVPDDIQRVITRIRNIDVEFRGLLCDVDHFYDLAQGLRTVDMNTESRKSKRRRFLTRMHQTLIRAQEIGDEKMHLVNQMQELIDSKTRQLEVNENLDVREDLQQLQQMQMSQVDVSTVQMPKHLRAQSPLLAEELINRNYNNSADNVVRIMAKEGSFVPYNVLPNTVPSTSDVNTLGGSNIMNNDVVRGNNKRSRRRNDTANEYDQFALNEAGNSVMGVLAMNERSTTSRAINVSNQKKLNAHGSGNMGVNTTNSLAAVQSSNSSVISSNSSTGKKKKRKTGGRHTANQNQLQTNAREDTPPLEAIDPDEPTYCVCNQISFGEMILCDNDLCPIEWFHFSCVFLTLKPKGKWYCPNCRGDRPNVMKPKAQFLKELERYNKEKEEKP